ncbi:MAG: sigma factor [Bryobacterales bacterium]
MSLPLPEESHHGSLPRLDDLFAAHYECVARVIGRVIHDQARAEEIAVDVFLKWSRNPRAHRNGAEGWIYRAAAREALDEWRRQARRYRFARIFAPFLPTPRTPEQFYAAESEQRNVRTVLAALQGRMASLLLFWAEATNWRRMRAGGHRSL